MPDIAARFERRFGRKPRLFRAPGRINIIGEHTDYTGGLVMPAAIDRFCTVAIAPNGAGTINVHASAFENTVSLSLMDLQPRHDWSDYVAGVAAVLQSEGITLAGCDVMIESDVPIGAGISSSAALEIAVAIALLALAARAAEPRQIALWCQEAENNFVGMPCGIMDQVASACARSGSAMLLDCRDQSLRYLAVPADCVFLVVNSMVKHALVEGEYRSRREDCERAVEQLGLASLRELSEDDLFHAKARLTHRAFRRVRHVVSENARVLLAAKALEKGDPVELGSLMNRSHDSLRDDMEVSIPEVDRLVAVAQATPGVYGARMMGGGFGGAILALVSRRGLEQAQRRIVGEYGALIGKTPDAFACRLMAGAHEIVP